MAAKKSTRITRKYLRDRDACYSDAEISAVVPVRGLTALQVCDRSQVPAEDRLWVLLHTDWLSARQLRLLACKWARSALEAERAAGREPDKRSWHAVEVAERFARGKATREELAAAEAAARTAAGDDARDAQIADVRAVLSRNRRTR